MKVVRSSSLTHRPSLLPGISWYSFLEAEWNCLMPRKKSPVTGDRSWDPPTSALTTTPPQAPQRFITAFKRVRHPPRQLLTFRNMAIFFYGEELLALRLVSKPEEHPSSAVIDCLFNIFAATLRIAGRSSIRRLRTRHAVVTRIHLARLVYRQV